MQLEHVRFDVEDAVGVITLDRPDKANAQSPKVLEELDHAWNAADEDADVKVIVFQSTGRHFSAGHDMTPTEQANARPKWQADRHYDWETRRFLHYAKSWREVPKPSIAAVQGKCIAAGLMLCWPCDLIIAADNAEFSDPVLYMGIAGVEFHGHTWELGPRKAKELLFAGDSISAEEARQLGMVNRVVPLEELLPATMALARRIARQDSFALRMAKRAVNHTLDVQGFSTAVDAVFDMHQLGHARAAVVNDGRSSVLAGLTSMKRKARDD
ncbi:enoyl-CoA hydratase [Frankia sp. CNm7]|uniref:Enoyl-CoA hydratase n=1 Tax=Frankia nepalensis TaxID=1836974 RepID=A0A937RNM1_9ACTN|nr:enoyl-CoA hydratase [Frankia nepalensis]MBL7499173.1 enoyl-CoA hydratase [Frankia nepalensis]MBL7511009.1 enoyl-CoA hydratase [Frankia nepalensis]MBL7520523.1 enoyl-CoA hydratase [Frankia nepalensis]MBL7632089.1 enoyl-CoA hydratase [Frankia nepalensis]